MSKIRHADKHQYKRLYTLIWVYMLMLPTIGMAGIIAQPQPVAGAVAQSPAAGNSYGYICRLAVRPQYHTSEDITVNVVAFYSEGGRYVPKPVNVNIRITYAGVGGIVKEVNATIDDNREHTINLGRLEMATYTITATFKEAGDIKRDNFIVLHDPVPYYLAINRGELIRFKSLSEDKNDTFTVKILLQYSADRIEEKTYTNTSGFEYDPPAGVKVMSIYVVDKYGNINGMNAGQPYVWVYAEDKTYNLYRIVGAVVIFIAVIVAMGIVWGRIHED